MIRFGLLTAKPLLSPAQFETITGLIDDPVAARLSHTVWQTIARGELAEPNYTVSPMRYLFRTVTTPREKHFLLMKLPDNLFFGYYPVKIVHDYVLLPVHKALKTLR